MIKGLRGVILWYDILIDDNPFENYEEENDQIDDEMMKIDEIENINFGLCRTEQIW
jgi:hypothetical protein